MRPSARLCTRGQCHRAPRVGEDADDRVGEQGGEADRGVGGPGFAVAADHDAAPAGAQGFAQSAQGLGQRQVMQHRNQDDRVPVAARVTIGETGMLDGHGGVAGEPSGGTGDAHGVGFESGDGGVVAESVDEVAGAASDIEDVVGAARRDLPGDPATEVVVVAPRVALVEVFEACDQAHDGTR